MLHTVVAGGHALQDSMTGFHDLAANFGGQYPLYVWRNEYFGPVGLKGIDFEASETCREHQRVVDGIVTMRRYNSDAFGVDIEEMLSRKLTFDEPLGLADFIVFQKSRLQRVKREFYQILDMVLDRGAVSTVGEPS